MAEKGEKGFPILKRKVVFKPLTPKQASLKKDKVPVKEDGVIQLDSSDSDSEASLKKDNVPMEEDGVVQLDSSDSDSTGFVDTANGSLLQGSGKAPKEALKSGKKPSLDSLKTGTKTSSETPATKDIPKDARVLMDCEAATILQGIHESMTVLSDDPNIKMPEDRQHRNDIRSA